MKKRLLSLLLVLVLVMTLLPMSVFAASNANTVKASEVAQTDTNDADNENPPESEDADAEQAEPISKGNPEGDYTVTVLNDSNGPVKYKITYQEETEEIVLEAGQSCLIGVNEGDTYGVDFLGAINNRYTVDLSSSAFESGEYSNSNIGSTWTHTLGEGFKNGQTETKWYYTKDGERVDVDEDDVGSKDGFYYQKSESYTYTVKKAGYFFSGYTFNFTNDSDSSDKYSNKSSDTIENEIKSKFSAEYGEPVGTKSDYPLTSLGSGYYIIGHPATKEIIDLYDDCPADDVTLTFTSTVAPKTGGIEVRVYSAEVTKTLQSGLSNLSGALSDLAAAATASVPDVTLKLVEKESNEGYEGKEYVLEETGRTSTYVTYSLPKDAVLIGDYDLVIESIDEAGFEVLNGTHNYDVSIEEGKIAGEPEKLFGIIIGTPGIGEMPISGNTILSTLGYYNGIYLSTVEGFCFTKVDVSGKPVEGATFAMVNRDQTVAILKYIQRIGQKNFETVINNMQDSETFSWQEVIELNTQLIKTDEEGNIGLDFENVAKLFTTYMALLNGVQLIDEEEGFYDLVLPAVLESTSKEDGKVSWNTTNNCTVSLMISTVREIIENFGPDVVNAILGGGENTLNLSDGMMALMDTVLDYGEGLADTTGYNLLRQMGIVGERLPAGYYILFEKSVPKDEEGNNLYLRNPMYYTVKVEWKNDNWVYASVANLGIILPYIAEEYYDFIRENSLATTTDKVIQKSLGVLLNKSDEELTEYSSVFSDIVNNKVDVTANMIAFTSKIMYQYSGAKYIYKSEDALTSDLMKVLYAQGRTTQNLMVFANEVGKRQKGVITGELNEDWYFYNLESSIFKTMQKTTKTIADDLADSIVTEENAGNYEAVQQINEKAKAAEEALAAEAEDNGSDDAEPVVTDDAEDSADEETVEIQDAEEETEKTTGFVDITAYKDLNPNRWYYTAVKWALTNKVMAGVTTTDFRTATPVTRGMAVTVLYAAADKPEYENGATFEDVSSKRYYYDAISWAKENGVAEGLSDTIFAPDKTMTRQELATMLKKYCEVMGIDLEETVDIDLGDKVDAAKVSKWAKTGMQWALKVGALTGLTKDTIDPLDVVTRAQLAQMMYKILTPASDSEAPATDTETTTDAG